MNKIDIIVPEGVKFISEWEGYNLPTGHSIVSKGVTGCGYTELALRNKDNVILCSPRKMLLENKRRQHIKDKNILYLENTSMEDSSKKSKEGGEESNYDDIREQFYDRASKHILDCQLMKKPVKFMVTYDSAHHLINYLQEANMLSYFFTVVDEFQSIFVDAFFKAEVENNFLTSDLQKCPNVIFLSATPVLDKYLDMIDEFKNLPFYQLDWSKTGWVETLQLQQRRVKSLNSEINKIIREYKDGKFPVIVPEGEGKVYTSTEAVFFVNSVLEIRRAITTNKLNPEEVNILCAKTEENIKLLKKIKHQIGEIPLEGEKHKMFTFCTSTVYMGADFYSTCASTFVFADPNLQHLALDISVDLPQIAGRQRLRENPFKNNITIFYKILREDEAISRENFDKVQEVRRIKTLSVLDSFSGLDEWAQKSMVEAYEDHVLRSKYSKSFIGLGPDNGLVYNRLVEISNERAWEIQQDDYKDQISVTKKLIQVSKNYPEEYKFQYETEVSEFVRQFFALRYFHKQLELFCEFMDNNWDNQFIHESVKHKITDIRFWNYYNYFGTDKCRAMKYQDGNLSRALMESLRGGDLRSSVLNNFEVGKRYDFKYIKDKLSSIYTGLGLSKPPKATDLSEWFELKKAMLVDENKKRVNGYEILKIKEE